VLLDQLGLAREEAGLRDPRFDQALAVLGDEAEPAPERGGELDGEVVGGGHG
jgi:hypothetical protein